MYFDPRVHDQEVREQVTTANIPGPADNQREVRGPWILFTPRCSFPTVLLDRH
jgi:hypothetical protein